MSEHDGWADQTDRELLSYAWTVLSKAERVLPHDEVVWAEVATAAGHLHRRLCLPMTEPTTETT